MKMISIRRITGEDTSIFRDVRLRALQDSPDAFGATYESAMRRTEDSWREQVLQCATGSLRNTVLAFDGRHCIGIASLYREPDAKEGEILQMWVAPEFRGTGTASNLVSELLQWAEAVGIQAVVLTVATTNDTARNFYEKCGFRPTGEEIEVDASRHLSGYRMKRIGSEAGAAVNDLSAGAPRLSR